MNGAVWKPSAPRPPTRRARFVDANFTHDIPDFPNDGCPGLGFLAGRVICVAVGLAMAHRITAGGRPATFPCLAARRLIISNVHDGGLIIDGTFGAGGYTRDILARANCHVIGIDRDPAAIAAGADMVEDADGRLVLFEGRFSELEDAANGAPVDGVVLDLGVSSMQLDQAERGFSFRFDGPLDMRMEGEGPSAADVVAKAVRARSRQHHLSCSAKSGIRAALRARSSRARAEAPITTTKALADLVGRVVRGKPGDIHPATRTFQALRLFVNDELGELVTALAAAERVLKPGGRLVVVSFHSLEDRIVKNFFADRSGGRAGSRHRPEVAAAPATFKMLTKRPVVADERKSPPIRARARPSCARRNVPMRRRAISRCRCCQICHRWRTFCEAGAHDHPHDPSHRRAACSSRRRSMSTRSSST